MFSQPISILKNSFFASLVLFGTVATAREIEPTQQDLINFANEQAAQVPQEVIDQLAPMMKIYNDFDYIDRIQTLAYTSPVRTYMNGARVELIDESIWTINPRQKEQILGRWPNAGWTQEDCIFIKPSISWFSSYPYVLHNRTKGETVEVKFTSMPQRFGMYRQQISKIDPYNRLIELDDEERTVWQINSSNSTFNFFSVGDYVIVGVNNYWRTTQYPHILINASTSSAPYCEANFVGYGR